MTLAEYRGLKEQAGHEAAHGPHETAHPGPAEYARIGIILAVVTAVEVAMFYAGIAQWALVSILVVLSGVKFTLVVLWFMHLKFDARLFSTLFVAGILLAGALFVVVLATLGGGLV
jgi:heme/copper-type cytochrome/quinol oxidase subunit 4